MRFLKRIAGILGLAKDEHEPHEARDVDDEHDVPHGVRTHREEVEFQDPRDPRGPRGGFSVPAQVVVEKAPLLLPCTSGDGGVQVYSLSLFFACYGWSWDLFHV